MRNVSLSPSIFHVALADPLATAAYPMVLFMFVGCTIFARSALRGQPKLQQSLMKLPIYTALFSDVSVFQHCLHRLSRDRR